MTDRSLTRRLAEFIVNARVTDITPIAQEIVDRAVADTIACAVAGSRTTIGQKIKSFVLATSARGGSTTFDGERSTDPQSAALLNGTWSHIHDYDDTNHPMYGHPSCHLVPAVLAVFEDRLPDSSGRDMVLAYLVGHQVEVAISYGMNMGHYLQGFHATGTLGTLGAAAAAAKALELTVDECAHALGIAASMASGLRVNVGTHTKPLHAGRASSNGVTSAMLAAIGWEAAPVALEGPTGFCFAFQDNNRPTNIEPILSNLDRRWLIEDPYGHQIKPFPSCGATHPAIEAALELRQVLRGEGIALEDIEAVEVGVSRLLPEILVYMQPQTGYEGKFSLEYTVARALLTGWPRLGDFTDQRVSDVKAQTLGSKVRGYVHPRFADNTEFGCQLTVRTATGREFSAEVEFAIGKNARPMTEKQFRAKLEDCLQFGVGASVNDVPGIVNQIRNVSQLERVGSLGAALIAGALQAEPINLS